MLSSSSWVNCNIETYVDFCISAKLKIKLYLFALSYSLILRDLCQYTSCLFTSHHRHPGIWPGIKKSRRVRSATHSYDSHISRLSLSSTMWNIRISKWNTVVSSSVRTAYYHCNFWHLSTGYCCYHLRAVLCDASRFRIFTHHKPCIDKPLWLHTACYGN